MAFGTSSESGGLCVWNRLTTSDVGYTLNGDDNHGSEDGVDVDGDVSWT